MMEKLDLHPRITHALRKCRITYPRTVLETSQPDLCRITKLSVEDVQILVRTVAKTIERPPAVSALDLYKNECNEVQIIRKLSTGCAVLDSHLQGGILSQGITEISGESSSGKTQMCLQFCLAVQLPCHFGGLDGTAVLISTEDVFPSKRLQQMIAHFEEKYQTLFNKSSKSLGDKVYIEHAADSETLLNIVRTKLPSLIAKTNVKLIIVDSIAALIRMQFSRDEMVQRSRVINSIGAGLRALSCQNNVPVICVNQVSAVFSASPGHGFNQDHITPSLGLTWSNLVTVRLMLSRSPHNNANDVVVHHVNYPQRQLKVVFAPHLPNTTCCFVVDAAGVHGCVK